MFHETNFAVIVSIYKIYIIKDWSRGNNYTKYRILHEKFHFNKPVFVFEVIEIYGQNCDKDVCLLYTVKLK